MKPNIKLDGYTSGEVLVNTPPVFMQRVSRSDTSTKYIAKTASHFDSKESKKLDYEVQIINRIYDSVGAGLNGKGSGSGIIVEASTTGFLKPNAEASTKPNAEAAIFGGYISTNIEDIKEVESGDSVSYYTSTRIPPVIRSEKLFGTVLFFRDSDLQPLRQFMQEKPLSLHSATNIIAMITEGLSAIHQAQIAHLNLNPDCFFVKEAPDEKSAMSLEIFDFRNSLYIGESGSTFHLSPESSAQYISPEQSGRMSKKIDGRSDIYSLGIIFWELLVGHHPFEGADKENMIYYHIAKKIPDVNTANTNIPKVLSAIISKMISKDRSDRYQDVKALKYDLFEILPDNATDGEILSNDKFCSHLSKFNDFKLAKRDKSNLLVMKEENIHRPAESEALQAMFSRDTNKFPLALVCLKGRPKTGKRSLVNQLAEHVQSRGGILIDCITSEPTENPFFVLIDKITKSILSRRTDQLLSTRNALLQGVGRDDIGMLIHEIPNIKSIMGVNFKTPNIETFNQSVFTNALKRFLEILLSTISTVIYLPNIIENEAALDLLKVIVTGKKLKAMIIFHFDYDLIDKSNQFCTFAEGILLEGFRSLELQNLTLQETSSYLGTLLIPTDGNLGDLAELMYRKCGGNPFYLKELISFSATNNLFQFDEDLYVWTWSLEQLRYKLKITENVANELVGKLNTIPKELIDILRAGSMMGIQFELAHIERTLHDSNFDANVEKLVDLQYLTPLQTGHTGVKRNSSASRRRTSSFSNRHTLQQKISMYELSSPRIRVAVLDGLSPVERGMYCSKLVLMSKEMGLSLAKFQYDEFLLLCNETIEMIDDPNALEILFVVNLTLAKYSLRTGNSKDSLADFAHANSIMMKNADTIWEHFPEETFDMRAEYARLLLQHNASDLNSIKTIIDCLKKRENNRKKELNVIVLKLRLLELESDYDSMARLGKETLSKFGVVSYEEENSSYEAWMQKLFTLASGTPQQALRNAPFVDLTGEAKFIREVMFLNCIAQEIIERGSKPSGFLAQACCYELENGCSIYSCLYFSAMIKEFIKPGNSFDFARFRWIIEFSMLLIELAERETRNAASLAAMKGMDLIWPSSKMMSSMKEYLEASLQAVTFDAIMVIEIIYLYNFSIGTKLADIGAAIKSFGVKAKDSPLLHCFSAPFATDAIAQQTITMPKEFKVLPRFVNVVNVLLYEGIDEKRLILPEINMLIEEAYTMTTIIDVLMIKFLFLIDLIKDSSDDATSASFKADADSIMKMFENYSEIVTAKEQRCKILLVNAEDRKRNGNIVEAIALLEECIENASSSKNIFVQALANEHYGSMLIELQSKQLSKPCLLESIELWNEYGCEAKSKRLRSKFAFVLTKQVVNTTTVKKRNTLWENVLKNTVSATTASGAKKEDKTAMIELSSSLNQEKNLEVLLQKVSYHVITTANATKSVIMLAEKETLNINAISFLDDSGTIIHDTNVYNTEGELRVPLKPAFYVWRSGENMVLNDSLHWDNSFKQDEYLRQYRPKSFLCLPIIYQERITGVLYLENSLQNRAFTTANVELVESFITTAAVAIENARLQKMNQELANELESKNTAPPLKLSFDSPIQKVLESLQLLKSKFEFDPAESRNIDMMIQILNSDDLFKADLNFNNELDSEIKNWIETTLMQQELLGKDNAAGTILPETSIRVNTQPDNVLKSYLELTDPMDFDIFKFSELANQQPLYYMAMHLFHELRLFEGLKIQQDKASKFFQRIESNYNQLPYHNSTHAADLMRTIRSIVFDTPLCSKFTEIELASLIIGAAIHDVDHPGVNNNFLILLNHPVAVLYNDTSVLENHHVALSFEIARDAECNIYEGLDPVVFTTMRKYIIQSVLATDLAMHFQILNKFKAKVTAGNLKMEEASDRTIVMEMAMKCGDLANPTRPLAQSIKWSMRVMEEFFNQGEREKLAGLPVSQFMDETPTNIPKCQVGFIDFLVAPMYDIWTSFSSTPFTAACTANIASNREQWKQWQDDASTMPPFPPKPVRKDEMLDMKILSVVKFGNITPSQNPKYWSMMPNLGSPTDQHPSRRFGSGLRVLSMERRNSELPSTNLPDLSVSGRPSFRKVVQALIPRVTESSPSGSPRESSPSGSPRVSSVAQQPPVAPVVMTRPRSATDPKRPSIPVKRASGLFVGTTGDRRTSFSESPAIFEHSPTVQEAVPEVEGVKNENSVGKSLES